jgi:DNA polymerase-3 subunit epsilon
MDTKKMVEALEATGNFRVLQRLNTDVTPLTPPYSPSVKRGLVLDTETTGRSAQDKIIELGMVLFLYDGTTGEILGVEETFNGLEDPGVPIPPEATAVNHITDDMVKGQRLDDAAVEALANKADLVIAHNSAFDRGFMTRRFPFFDNLPWACSLSEVKWEADFGSSSGKLEFLAMRAGFFYEGHRAYIDCLACLEVLKKERWPNHEKSPFQQMLETSRKPSFAVYAINSPYESKDNLKANGYRWDDGSSGAGKSWWKLVSQEQFQPELEWLASSVYEQSKIRLQVSKLTALTRFRGTPAERIDYTYSVSASLPDNR